MLQFLVQLWGTTSMRKLIQILRKIPTLPINIILIPLSLAMWLIRRSWQHSLEVEKKVQAFERGISRKKS